MLSDRTAMVISVSNRAAAGVYEDTTGPSNRRARCASWAFKRSRPRAGAGR